VFIFLGFFIAATVIFVYFLVPETKGFTVKENLEKIVGKDALDR